MVVLGKHAFIFESTGRTCSVRPFSSELGVANNVPIVDGAIAYDCPYTQETSILIVRNALHIPSMEHNLIPPFIMRAGGIIVNDTAKIHCADPTTNDHCILFPTSDLRIPLQLHGIFSYFHSRLPTITELYDCDKYFITPDASDWNPNCSSFENNERAMLNYEGDLASPNRRTNLPMEVEDIANDIFEMASVTAEQWNSQIDINISSSFASICHLNDDTTANNNDAQFANALAQRCEISKLCASIGSCTISDDTTPCELFCGPTTATIDGATATIALAVATRTMACSTSMSQQHQPRQ